MSQHFFTVCAGLFAALAGVCGKVAADSSVIASATSDATLQYGLRVLFGGGVVLSNVLMWHCFVRSLHQSNSVVAATLNSLLNLVFTALLCRVVLGEALSTRWLVGAATMSVGVALVLTGTTTAVAAPSRSQRPRRRKH